jgi:hypothetical protein
VLLLNAIPSTLAHALQDEGRGLPAGMGSVAKAPLVAETAAWIFSLCRTIEDEEFTTLLFVGDD